MIRERDSAEFSCIPKPLEILEDHASARSLARIPREIVPDDSAEPVITTRGVDEVCDGLLRPSFAIELPPETVLHEHRKVTSTRSVPMRLVFV